MQSLSAFYSFFSSQLCFSAHGILLKCCILVCWFLGLPHVVDRSLKRRQVKPLAASLLDALDYDSSDDSDFQVGDASGKYGLCDV